MEVRCILPAWAEGQRKEGSISYAHAVWDFPPNLDPLTYVEAFSFVWPDDCFVIEDVNDCGRNPIHTIFDSTGPNPKHMSSLLVAHSIAFCTYEGKENHHLVLGRHLLSSLPYFENVMVFNKVMQFPKGF